MNAELKRAKACFSQRQPWESYWDLLFRFMAPERAVFFREQDSDPGSIGEEIFDSTAPEDTAKLAAMVVAKLTPPWSRWLRLLPGSVVAGAQRSRLEKELRRVEDVLFETLPDAGFYDELEALALDAIIGGTGNLSAYRTRDGLRWRCTPLARVALGEDYTGRVTTIAVRDKWSVEDLERRFPGKLPRDLTEHKKEEDKTKPQHTVYRVSALEADGQWKNCYVLDHAQGESLEVETGPFPEHFPFRWTRVPGSPYGRGPGSRALSDTRAVNKLKELTLKNAAKAVAGVYTAWHDGVLNPHTIGFEPGTVIPVASNNIQDPPIAELPNTARFDVSEFSIGELTSSLKRIFLADQFGPLQRTPRSAEEISERSLQIAQDLGASIHRLLREVVLPAVSYHLDWLRQEGLIDVSPELLAPGAMEMRVVSHLARGQEMEEAQTIIQYAGVVAQFGEVDPKAGLVYDTQSGLRRVAERWGIHPDDMRSERDVEQLMQQGAEADARLSGGQDREQ